MFVPKQLPRLLLLSLLLLDCRSPQIRFHDGARSQDENIVDAALDASVTETFDTANTETIDTANTEASTENAVETGTDALDAFDAFDATLPDTMDGSTLEEGPDTAPDVQVDGTDVEDVTAESAPPDVRETFVGTDCPPLALTIPRGTYPADAGFRCPSEFLSTAPTTPVPPPSPTRLRSLSPLSGRMSPLQPTVRWHSAPEVTSVRVEWSRDRHFATVEFSQEISMANRATAPSPLAAGVWYWRVRELTPTLGPFTRPWQLVVSATVGATNHTLFDINGDGLGDFVYGIPGASSGHGGVRLHLGACRRAPGTTSDQNVCSTALESFGYGVTNAGDLDGDGYVDLAVGAPGTLSTTTSPGRVLVFWGGADGFVRERFTVLSPLRSTTTFFGGRVAGVGDLDGDGYAELAVSSFHRDRPVNTFVEVFYGDGSRSLTRNEEVPTLFTNAAYINGTGDLDRDGLDDLVVSSEVARRVEVFSWSSSINRLSISCSRMLVATPSRFGRRFTSFDSNSDGEFELVVSDPDADSSRGVLFVFRCTGATLEVVDQQRRPLGPMEMNMGEELNAIGDIDGNGFEELAVNIGGTTENARVLFYSASTTGFASNVLGVRRVTEAQQGTFGASIEWLGDMDGDLRGEFAIGTGSATLGTATLAGAITLFHLPTTFPPTFTLFFQGTAGDQLGHSIALSTQARRNFPRLAFREAPAFRLFH